MAVFLGFIYKTYRKKIEVASMLACGKRSSKRIKYRTYNRTGTEGSTMIVVLIGTLRYLLVARDFDSELLVGHRERRIISSHGPNQHD